MFGKQQADKAQHQQDTHSQKQTEYQPQPVLHLQSENYELLSKQLDSSSLGQDKQQQGMFPSLKNNNKNKNKCDKKDNREEKLPFLRGKGSQAEVLDNRKKELFSHFRQEGDDEDDEKEAKQKKISAKKLDPICQIQTKQTVKEHKAQEKVKQQKSEYQQNLQQRVKQAQIIEEEKNNIKEENQRAQKQQQKQKICEPSNQKSTQKQPQPQPKPQPQPQPQPEALGEQSLMTMTTIPQQLLQFSENWKSPSIELTNSNTTLKQTEYYFQNKKLALSAPITSLNSFCRFRVDNIKYCIGFGIALQEVIQKHDYNYQSEGNKELNHGLYIVTSQGFSWSHSQKQEDDVFRNGFNCLYTGALLQVSLQGQALSFKWKKGEFQIKVPMHLRNQYKVCFCVYLHQKNDAVSISQ